MLTETVTQPYDETARKDIDLCHVAGWLLFNLERKCWPDVFANYDQLHQALGVPMSWAGPRSVVLAPIALTQHVGRILRSIGEPDHALMLRSADQEFRRMRCVYAAGIENDIRHLTNKLDQAARNYTDDSTGMADMASDAAYQDQLIAQLAVERMALAGTHSPAQGA